MLVLESAPFYPLEPMAVVTAKACLELIQKRSVKKWGEEKWVAELARAYVDLAKAHGDEEATYENRRSQIHRTFKVWSCNADTLLMLMSCVGCRLQLVCEDVIDL